MSPAPREGARDGTARGPDDPITRLPDDDERVGPSAPWGWHDAFPRAVRVAGLVTAVILVALMFTQDVQQTTQPRLWLGAVAVAVFTGALAYRGVRRRGERRRS
jgi:hypothetical protein